MVLVGSVNGDYSVKLGYRCFMDARFSQYNFQSPVHWKHLWKLKIPSKIRFFLWRALSNCLPMRTALAAKNIDVPSLCPVCNLEPESIFHILIACAKAQSIWALSEVGDLSASVSNLVDWWAVVCALNGGMFAKFGAMIVWAIWSSRNNLVWNNSNQSARVVFDDALSSLQQWEEAQPSI